MPDKKQPRKYRRSDRPACLQLIRDRSLHSTSLQKIANIFLAELGFQVSLPAVSEMRQDICAEIQEKTTTAAAQASISAITRLGELDPSRYVDLVDAQISELRGRLYDPCYAGTIPLPETLADRLKMEEQLTRLVSNLLSITGPPPKVPDDSLIPKRDVMGILAEREAYYLEEYILKAMKIKANPQKVEGPETTSGANENIPHKEEESDNPESEDETL